MLHGITACNASGLDFSEVFTRQYLIARDPNLDIPTFSRCVHGDRTVYYCPKLNVTRIMSVNGIQIGILIGTGIDANGNFLRDTYVLPATDTPLIEFIEDSFLKTLAGKYVLYIAAEDHELVYGDAAISMPCVYNPETKIVASSLLLTKFEDLEPTSFFNGEKIYMGGGKFGFGKTADRSVFRHQANFVLDLKSFSLTRFWPRPDLAQTPETPDTLLLKIQSKLKQNITSIIVNMECMFAMSGGRDSRVLLGYTVPLKDKIFPFHTVKHNWISQFDVSSSAILARVCGLEHKVYDVSEIGKLFPEGGRKAFRNLRRKIWFSKGYVCDISTRMDYALEHMLPRGKTVIRGNMLELLNAQWTPKKHFAPGTIECFEHILKRSQFEDDPTERQNNWRVAQLAMWYAELPQRCKSSVYDLAYIELFLSNNQCALLSDSYDYIAPFCDRQIFEWSMQLPLEFRMTTAAHSWLIRNSDVPELAEAPLARQLIAERKAKRD